jgi:hypothetical protein
MSFRNDRARAGGDEINNAMPKSDERVTRKAYAEDSIELVCSAAKGGAMKPRFAFSGSDVLFLESAHVIFI